jgi:hypothetical protein
LKTAREIIIIMIGYEITILHLSGVSLQTSPMLATQIILFRSPQSRGRSIRQ